MKREAKCEIRFKEIRDTKIAFLMNQKATKKLPEEYSILGVKIHAVQPSSARDIVLSWFEEPLCFHYISSTNINNVITALENKEFFQATNEADLSLPDGMPLLWYGRLSGYKLPKRCGIEELMYEIFKLSEQGYDFSHYFYGNEAEVLCDLVSMLRQRYPKLRIAGTYSPPFRQLSAKETDEIIENINRVKPDFLWVSLGCPKQELWMYRNQHKLNVRVAGGAGAVFNFIAGHTPRAPVYIQYAGLEWLFRLMLNPRRLSKRYLVKYPKFFVLLLANLFRANIRSL